MRQRILSILGTPDHTIREVMSLIEAAPKVQPEPAPSGIVLILEADRRLIGVVSDGDIRRAVLAKSDLDANVSTIMNTKPVHVPTGMLPTEMVRSVRRQLEERGVTDGRIDRIVIVDGESRPVDVVSFFELWKESEVGARRVCVIGLGFVGLTLAVTFAESGFEVIGIERNEEVLGKLEQGIPHFHEKNLPTLLKRHAGKRLQFASTLEKPLADVYVVSVGTPMDEATETVRYDYLLSAAEDIGRVLKVGDLVVLRSTVPLGTTREQFLPILERTSGLQAGRDFSLAFAPERTVEGKALEELRTLPQIVGGLDDRSADLAARLFRSLAPTIITLPSLEAAEMVKLINNSFRDHIFAFANQVALVCDEYQLPSRAIIDAANEGYPRDRIPRPSPGVGGICLRKDPFLFLESARRVGLDMPLVRASRALNAGIPAAIAKKVETFCQEAGLDFRTVTVGLLGVAFKGKPETSDTRGSTALDVVASLRARGLVSDVLAHDPLVSEADLTAGGMTPSSLDGVFKRSQVVLLLTNHAQYESLDVEQIAGAHTVKYFFDGWQLYQPATFTAHGIRYDSLGTDAEMPPLA